MVKREKEFTYPTPCIAVYVMEISGSPRCPASGRALNDDMYLGKPAETIKTKKVLM